MTKTVEEKYIQIKERFEEVFREAELKYKTKKDTNGKYYTVFYKSNLFYLEIKRKENQKIDLALAFSEKILWNYKIFNKIENDDDIFVVSIKKDEGVELALETIIDKFLQMKLKTVFELRTH